MGVNFVDLDIPAGAGGRAVRLERARAALGEVEERKKVKPLPQEGPLPLKGEPGFDRVGYQREYMRARRARKRAEKSA